ncbi:YbaK/ProRS associated domain-containing protein [Violaceomyces palustris]|uniref:YbaK/ProRS associated domain-containing protein n=1 Tax=Violaceomyces palustris TaxID=1673888 RepID=A0ACD0NQB8_9BASI|nr:YbaK/ProRS associated domain-containing protein [Violaceomyces palustris]
MDTYDRLINLLQSHKAKYQEITHEHEGRSDLIANIRGHDPMIGAKAMVVLVKTSAPQPESKTFYLVVLPGPLKIDMKAVASLTEKEGAEASLAPTKHMRRLTKCQSGAVPPFSFHDELLVVVDQRLLEGDEIAFNAGRLDRSVRMSSEDFQRIARPLVSRVALDDQGAAASEVREG